MALITATTAMMAALVATDPARTVPLDCIAPAALALASLNGAASVANGLRRRQFSLLHAMMAQARHHI